MVSSLYLSRRSSDFNEIWCATADFGSKDGHVTKYQNFANSKWRTVAILKIVFGYISTIYCPINVKFDTKKHNYVQIQVIWPKYQNLKIQDGGRSPFWKMVSSLYLSCGSSDINEIWCIIWFQERSIIKVSIFCKFKMADGRFVCERLYVGLQISWVLRVNRRCPPIWLLYKDKSAICTH